MRLRVLAVLGLVLVPIAARAEEHECACCAKGTPGDHAQMRAPTGSASAAPAYDAEYEGVIAGVIYSVMRHAGMDVQLTIGAGEKSVQVLVAPTTWLDGKQIAFRPGERVEIVGAREDHGSGDAIVAREIHTADQTVVTRDTQGRPLWD